MPSIRLILGDQLSESISSLESYTGTDLILMSEVWQEAVKADLATKICPVCEKPFSWRKKWSKDWPHVLYCSKPCRSNKNNPLR